MTATRDQDALRDATIADFGDQWTRYRDNEGYYGSAELLADILEPLVPLEELRGIRVAEIGAGTGRIVSMLLDAGVAEVTALEPSDAFDVLVENTASRADRVRCIRARGEDLPREPPFDLVVSIGVLHHIPDPLPVLRAAREALRPGGRVVAWLYGHEGNEAYLGVVLPLRRLTARLPHLPLAALTEALGLALDGYVLLCRQHVVKLPLQEYAESYLARLTPRKRRLVIYDQLKPAHARYYRREEVVDLFERAGLVDVRVHHRHGYSWTVVGRREAALRHQQGEAAPSSRVHRASP